MTDLDIAINKRLLEKYDEAIRMAFVWENDRDIAMPVLEKLDALGAEPYVMSDSHIAVSLTGDIDTLTSAIRAMRTGGYASASKPERKSPTFHAFYRHPEAKLEIFFQFSSSVCKRVQVGTETKTVPVYEIHCGESTEFAAEGA